MSICTYVIVLCTFEYIDICIYKNSLIFHIQRHVCTCIYMYLKISISSFLLLLCAIVICLVFIQLHTYICRYEKELNYVC